jgi:hypothetical protein
MEAGTHSIWISEQLQELASSAPADTFALRKNLGICRRF